MKKFVFLFVFTATQCLINCEIKAQNVDSTTVFGYVVPKPKLDSNGNPKHVFKPAFKRLGFTMGGLIPFNGGEGGGTSGIRFEYGLSNKTSILLDFQGNNARDTSFSGGQASLLVRTMPFKARRLQPYFGIGYSIGGGQTGKNRFGGRDGKNYPNYVDNDTETNDNIAKHYAVGQVGLNYIVMRRVIASLDATYQAQIGGTNLQKYGAASVKFGLAYQFGKRK